MKFITQQKKLTELTIFESLVNDAVRYCFEREPLEAKLQVLWILYPKYPCNCKKFCFLHLKAFVESQRESLKELTVKGAKLEEEATEYLLSLELTKLRLLYSSLKWSSK